MFDENFMSPLSHDEVVHLKKSLFSKMPGDEWQQFANLRLLYAFQWLYPGKQLLFMGGEFAQTTEWNCATALPWDRSRERLPRGVHDLVGDLNRMQAAHPALEAQIEASGTAAVRFSEEPSLADGQAYLRIGKAERQIDLAGALERIRGEIRALYELNERTLKYG